MYALDDFVTRHRFTVDDFQRMGEAGVFTPDARVELIDGQIVEMHPLGFAHFHLLNESGRRLVLACGDRAVVSIQLPIRLSRWTELRPDVAVYRAVPGGYRDWPKPADSLLVIEVSETSSSYDRMVKRRHYARAGIPEYWIVDANARRFEVCTTPIGENYDDRVVIAATGRRALAARPEVEVELEGLFLPRDAS